jgi:hypothetical protein
MEPTLLRSIIVTACLALAVPSLAQAADGLDTRTDSSFKLLPGQDRFKVAVDVTLINRKAPTSRVQGCPSNPGLLCRVTTNYYFNGWGNLYVPAGATQLKISSPNVRASVEERTHDWTAYQVAFPNLNYGQTRRIRASYELPGEKPRSQHRTRIMDAYTYFCWHGEPGDRGVVTAELPAGYEATTFGGATRTKSTRKGTTITAAIKGNPGRFYACTDAFKPSELIRTELTTPSGQAVVVEGWPEDTEWSERTAQAVEESLPELEDLMGRAMPFDEVTLREVSEQSLYGYGSEFGLRAAVIRLGEHIEDPSAAPSALASAWINERRIADTWLDMGLSDWAGNEVSGSRCWPAGDYPGNGNPRLGSWKVLRERPSEQLQAIVDWQYDAACGIVQGVADAVGAERMRAVIGSLIDGTPKYGPQPAERQGAFRKATWKDWLDAADELGLVPAGVADLTVAEQALKEAGVATGRQLRSRATARSAYHGALAGMAGTRMPRFIDDLLGTWRFGPAMKAIPLAEQAYAAIMASGQMADTDRARFLDDFEAAESTRDLAALERAAVAFGLSARQTSEPSTTPSSGALAAATE